MRYLAKFVFISAIVMTLAAIATPEATELRSGYSDVWTIHYVDTYEKVGRFASLALDSGDNPHIAYFDDTNHDLRYAQWTGIDWKIETVDHVAAVGLFCSLALDSGDNPRIGYFNSTSSDLKYAQWNGVAWEIETVDSSGYVGQWTSLALDSADRPHMSYFDITNLDLKYAQWNGTAWNIETVDSEGWVGMTSSLALDSTGNPHIGYRDSTNFDQKYAQWNGTAWNIETVDSYGDVGGLNSIAIDSGDNPRISYYDNTNHDLKYAQRNGNAWNIETVDSVGDTGRDTSLALDSKELPHISYRDVTNGDLKYTHWNGTAWNIEVVDTVDDVGWFTSIALDTEDNPHIAYQEWTDEDLKYATKGELKPSEPTLSYSPSSMDFGTLPPGVTHSEALEIWNSGNGTLTYGFNESILWVIDISPPSGSSKGEHDSINVTIDTTDLSEGLHRGAVHIDSNGGNGTVNVSVEVLAPSRAISLDIDPDTLNLKSKGRWMTAYLSAENASVYDIDTSSILLQDTLLPERYDYHGTILMIKFDRQEFEDTVVVGESVEVKVTGKWKDGSLFEAYDYIRVIEPGLVRK